MEPNYSEKLMHQFHKLSRLIHNKQHSAHGVDLVRGQGRVLRTLYDQDGLLQQDLAKEVRIQPGSLSELLAKLEQKNHIVRKVDPEDKRRYYIYITSEGRELASQIKEARNRTSEEIFAPLSAEEQKKLMVLFRRLMAGLDTNEGEDELLCKTE